jgi:alcohol dehydrogenase
MTFTFYSPTEVVFGKGASDLIGRKIKDVGGSKVLVVTTPGGVSRWESVINRIKNTSMKVEVFTKVQPNPRDIDCIKGALFAKERGVDLIVGLGGGSAMDTAKTIAVLLTHGGKPDDWAYPKTIEKISLPIICVPTTSGTGSEVTPFAVVTNIKKRYKMTLASSHLVPKVALVDPELTTTLSPSMTASTGIDALVHAIEAYTCKLANPISDILALKAIELIANNLEKAYLNPSDMTARENMMLASTLAGLAIGSSDVAGVHCMAEALGGMYDVPHGIANAIFLPIMFEYNISGNPEKYAKISEFFGVEIEGRTPIEVAKEGAKKIRKFIEGFKIPSLREIENVNPEDFPKLARYAAENMSANSNPVRIDEKGYLDLFKKCYFESTPKF